jgi:exodeoxyribonuclease VII small subunit
MNETRDQSFEDSLTDLERIVRDLEEGQLGLDDALARYEQGVALIRRCQAQLAQAEQRILVLTGLEPDGAPILQPFAHEATTKKVSATKTQRARREEQNWKEV